MSTFRSRVFAPFAAALMIGFTMAPPAQADPGDNNGQATQAQTQGNSAEAHENNADKAQSSNHDSDTSESSTPESHQTHGTASTRTGNPDTDSSVGGTEQPVSNADQNDGGANGQCSDTDSGDTGPYCGTKRVEDQAPNGAGDGEARGKPCAGCVGRADNKNPPGQEPNAEEDGNRGYECESPINKGIGPGNPAHTGCEDAGGVEGEPPTPPKTCPDGSVMPDDGECDKPNPPKGPCPDGDMNGAEPGCVSPTEECPKGDMNGDAPGCKPGPCPEGDMNGDAPGCQPDIAGEEDTDNPEEPVGFVEDVAPPADTPQVLGVDRTAPQALPETGAAEYLTLLMIAGLGLATAGVLTLLFRRRLESGR